MQDFERFTDEELVRAFKSGDEPAFTVLFNRYEPKLRRLIYYYVPNVDEADDVLQEAVIRVFRHIGTFDTEKSFSSWIYQIAINCSKNHMSRSRRESRLLEQERYRMAGNQPREGSPEDICISEHDMEELSRSVENLKDKFKTVFILRHDHKMKYSEIAEIMNCSERTAKWRMEKALEKIAQYLTEKGVI
ncbi:MAG TPA: RNA polymerase sigma factor [Spirochaetota bacterium]|nr:RNA polymerase sigma factor [Spirochaetota bacterium]HPV41548.1 RNA polymerase sigma factor [Spirochaetota bacterium]